MDDKSFSCVIASNGRDTLFTTALPSALKQSAEFAEILVVYDGQMIFDEKQEDFRRAGVSFMCSGKSLGGPYAQFEGYSQAKSDYVVLLDDDDAFDNEFVKELRNSLDRHPEKVALIVPSVHKVWPDLPLPTQKINPPCQHSECEGRCLVEDASWSPPTCSGLTLNRSTFPQLPIMREVRGFNDIQIWRASQGLKPEAEIIHSPRSVVYFTQSHSFERKTSSFDNRKKNIAQAAEFGITFSNSERNAILFNAIFSEARSRAYRGELLTAYSWAAEQLRKERLSAFDKGILRSMANIAVTVIAFVWPRISGRNRI